MNNQKYWLNFYVFRAIHQQMQYANCLQKEKHYVT